MSQRVVLIVGDYTHYEFQPALECLSQRCKICRASSVESACSLLRANPASPELIVIASSRPGRFSQAEIECLHRLTPLSRLLALLGSCCEGETCSGRPWSGVARVYWHQFIPRMERAVQQRGSPLELWSMPRTATDTERFDLSCRPGRGEERGLIAISAASLTVYEGLADACVQAGYAAAWFVPGTEYRLRNAAAGIWDDSSLTAGCPLQLGTLVRWIRPAPALAILHFPRSEDRRLASQAGAAAVLAKPFLLDDLCTELARVTGHAGTSPRADYAA